jgi:hypothetical protein
MGRRVGEAGEGGDEDGVSVVKQTDKGENVGGGVLIFSSLG